MRFLYIVIGVCKGIAKGIRNEIQRLAAVSKLNSHLKQRNEELLVEYERLGEYVYSTKQFVADEHVLQLVNTIEMLLEEMKQYEQQLTQLRDE